MSNRDDEDWAMKISAMGKMKNMPPADMDPQVVNMPPAVNIMLPPSGLYEND